MFRRDKDSKIDNEGLRRMREAIRQRLDEEGTNGAEATESGSYPTAGMAASETSYPTSTANSYESLAREPEYSYLGTTRQGIDRGLPVADQAEPAADESAWQPEQEAPTGPAITTVAADTSWNGTLRSSASVRIEGTFDGELVTEQELYVGPDAPVNATVHAATIIVAGNLTGRIECHERLEVRASGRGSGQIETRSIVVQEGAFMGGQLRMKTAGGNTIGNTDEQTRPMLQRVR
ncbi:MAG: bactofilin family protein [Thermomicrobiales bacterium]